MAAEVEKRQQSTREAFGEVILQLGADNGKIVVVDGDISRSLSTVEFSRRFPNRHYNVGIAEANQFGIAAGLAAVGYTPIVASYGVFASMRALEQVRTTICYPKLNVKIAASHGGLTPGNDGATHQAIEDIGIMRTLPNMRVVVPADARSLRVLLTEACALDGPVYVRLTRDAVPCLYGWADDLQIGKAKLLIDGSDVTIMAVGDMVQWALEARNHLSNRGISARVLDMHTIKPLDTAAVIAAAKATGAIVTVEDHSMYNGLGSAVAEVLVENHLAPMQRVALQDTFAESGPYRELLAKYGLGVESITEAAVNVIARKQGERSF